MKKFKYILGFQTYANHDSGASIIRFNKETVDYVAISEERLIREKYAYKFPVHSIKYCLDYYGLKNLSQIEFIVTDWIREKKWLRSGPGYSWSMFDVYKQYLKFDKKKIHIIDHHLAHAASVYYTSNFKDSAILIVDGNGSDLETNSYFYGRGKKISLIDKYKGYGIGQVYSAVTDEILNLGVGGEGKTMGLASYGKKNKQMKIPYNFDGIKTDFSKFMKILPNSDYQTLKLNNKIKKKTIFQKIIKSNKKNIMNKYSRDWAFKAQDLAEKTMIHLASDLYEKTKSKNLCLAGGVALNCIANEKIAKKTKYKNLFIFPACSDSGVPFGLATWGYYNLANGKKNIDFKNAYTGKSYSENELFKILDKFKINHFKISNQEIANLLSKNKLVGMFQGRSEYGPRALGNRSILANPKPLWMRDHINKDIKHREMFRPFAPIVLEKHSSKYFGIKKSPFMLRAGPCKKSKLMPAINHVDKTARVQTVSEAQNKKIYDIINRFDKLTKIPVILNTSFNDAGEPLVESHIDSIISFIKTNLDYLVIEDNAISRDKILNKSKILSKLLKSRKSLIKDEYIKAKKIIFNKFNENTELSKIKKKNKALIKFLKDKKYEVFGKFFNNLKKDKNYLILGSNDHTYCLLKKFKDISKSNKKLFFLEITQNDNPNNKKRKIKFLDQLNLNSAKKIEWENILISSHQHMNFILKNFIQINKLNKNSKEIFVPYKNYLRSIMDIN